MPVKEIEPLRTSLNSFSMPVRPWCIDLPSGALPYETVFQAKVGVVRKHLRKVKTDQQKQSRLSKKRSSSAKDDADDEDKRKRVEDDTERVKELVKCGMIKLKTTGMGGAITESPGRTPKPAFKRSAARQKSQHDLISPQKSAPIPTPVIEPPKTSSKEMDVDAVLKEGGFAPKLKTTYKPPLHHHKFPIVFIRHPTMSESSLIAVLKECLPASHDTDHQYEHLDFRADRRQALVHLGSIASAVMAARALHGRLIDDAPIQAVVSRFREFTTYRSPVSRSKEADGGAGPLSPLTPRGGDTRQGDAEQPDAEVANKQREAQQRCAGMVKFIDDDNPEPDTSLRGSSAERAIVSYDDPF